MLEIKKTIYSILLKKQLGEMMVEALKIPTTLTELEAMGVSYRILQQRNHHYGERKLFSRKMSGRTYFTVSLLPSHRRSHDLCPYCWFYFYNSQNETEQHSQC